MTRHVRRRERPLKSPPRIKRNKKVIKKENTFQVGNIAIKVITNSRIYVNGY